MPDQTQLGVFDKRRKQAVHQTYENLRRRFKGRLLYGRPVNINDPREVAVMASLWVVEDEAESGSGDAAIRP